MDGGRLMTTYVYSSYIPVYSVTTGTWVTNRVDGVLLNETGQVVAAQTLNGVETSLKVGPTGVLEPFQAPIARGMAKFGDVIVGVLSDFSMDGAVNAALAQSAALDAQVAAEACIAKAFPISNVGIDPDGTPYVSDEPVANGGVLVINQDGSVDAVFPY